MPDITDKDRKLAREIISGCDGVEQVMSDEYTYDGDSIADIPGARREVNTCRRGGKTP